MSGMGTPRHRSTSPQRPGMKKPRRAQLCPDRQEAAWPRIWPQTFYRASCCEAGDRDVTGRDHLRGYSAGPPRKGYMVSLIGRLDDSGKKPLANFMLHCNIATGLGLEAPAGEAPAGIRFDSVRFKQPAAPRSAASIRTDQMTSTNGADTMNHVMEAAARHVRRGSDVAF